MEDIIQEFQKLYVMDMMMFCYLLLTAIDFILGFLKAFKAEGFRSRKIRDGVIRVVAELIALIFGGVIDLVIGTPGIILITVKSLFIFKQGVSICENLVVLGVDVSFIKDYLEEFKSKGDK